MAETSAQPCRGLPPAVPWWNSSTVEPIDREGGPSHSASRKSCAQRGFPVRLQVHPRLETGEQTQAALFHGYFGINLRLTNSRRTSTGMARAAGSFMNFWTSAFVLPMTSRSSSTLTESPQLNPSEPVRMFDVAVDDHCSYFFVFGHVSCLMSVDFEDFEDTHGGPAPPPWSMDCAVLDFLDRVNSPFPTTASPRVRGDLSVCGWQGRLS